MHVFAVPAAHADEITDVLCEAFFDYPVMRFVLGGRAGYPDRLRTLVGFFVVNRVAREDLMLGIADPSGALVGVALVNLPTPRKAAAWLEQRREAVWAELGAGERARYEAFGAATGQFEREDPHHHLGMIGIRRAHQGRGLSRQLLEEVHAVAGRDAGSSGVSLSTELPRNVGLYEHFGYRVLGHDRVATELETWVMFRARDAGVEGVRPAWPAASPTG